MDPTTNKDKLSLDLLGRLDFCHHVFENWHRYNMKDIKENNLDCINLDGAANYFRLLYHL